MPKYIYGKYGRNAIDQFAKDLHYKQIHGHLPHINQREEKQIIDRARIVYEKDGKLPHKILERDFVKQILNPLQVRRDDFFDSGEVGEISKGFNFTERTKQIGSKYSERMRDVKRDEVKKATEEKKSSVDKSRSDEIRNKISASKNNYSDSPYGGANAKQDNFSAANSRFGGMSQNNPIQNNSKYGGMSQNNYSPSNLRFGGMASNNNQNISARLGGAENSPAPANKPSFLRTLYDKFTGGGSSPKNGDAGSAEAPSAEPRDNTNSD